MNNYTKVFSTNRTSKGATLLPNAQFQLFSQNNTSIIAEISTSGDVSSKELNIDTPYFNALSSYWFGMMFLTQENTENTRVLFYEYLTDISTWVNNYLFTKINKEQLSEDALGDLKLHFKSNLNDFLINKISTVAELEIDNKVRGETNDNLYLGTLPGRVITLYLMLGNIKHCIGTFSIKNTPYSEYSDFYYPVGISLFEDKLGEATFDTNNEFTGSIQTIITSIFETVGIDTFRLNVEPLDGITTWTFKRYDYILPSLYSKIKELGWIMYESQPGVLFICSEEYLERFYAKDYFLFKRKETALSVKAYQTTNHVYSKICIYTTFPEQYIYRNLTVPDNLSIDKTLYLRAPNNSDYTSLNSMADKVKLLFDDRGYEERIATYMQPTVDRLDSVTVEGGMNQDVEGSPTAFLHMGGPATKFRTDMFLSSSKQDTSDVMEYLRTSNTPSIWAGTDAEYAALEEKLLDTIYFTESSIFMGGISIPTQTLSRLEDVTLTNLTNNEVLTTDGSVWTNKSLPETSLGDLSDVTLTNIQEGDIIKNEAGEWKNTPSV